MIIQSIQRAIRLLALFSSKSPRLGISEISRVLGLHKATVQGIVRTLVQEGFLKQDSETQKYQLGIETYELGVIFYETLEVNQKSSGPAHQLSNQVQLLVRIAIYNKGSILITLNAYPRSLQLITSEIGLRAPAYCTAAGKAILAFLEKEELNAYLEHIEIIPFTLNTISTKNKLVRELEETRERGYSINRGEHLNFRAAIAAPIFGRDGKVMASICIAGETGGLIEAQTEKLANKVMSKASSISYLMGSLRRHELPTRQKNS